MCNKSLLFTLYPYTHSHPRDISWSLFFVVASSHVVTPFSGAPHHAVHSTGSSKQYGVRLHSALSDMNTTTTSPKPIANAGRRSRARAGGASRSVTAASTTILPAATALQRSTKRSELAATPTAGIANAANVVSCWHAAAVPTCCVGVGVHVRVVT